MITKKEGQGAAPPAHLPNNLPPLFPTGFPTHSAPPPLEQAAARIVARFGFSFSLAMAIAALAGFGGAA